MQQTPWGLISIRQTLKLNQIKDKKLNFWLADKPWQLLNDLVFLTVVLNT